jgi:hypothetical protein
MSQLLTVHSGHNSETNHGSVYASVFEKFKFEFPRIPKKVQKMAIPRFFDFSNLCNLKWSYFFSRLMFTRGSSFEIGIKISVVGIKIKNKKNHWSSPYHLQKFKSKYLNNGGR